MSGPPRRPFEVSAANQAGQYTFLARLQDNSVAAYRTEAEGTLSLILRSGAKTNLGTSTQMGSDTDLVGNGGIALNSQGQVALTVQIDNGPWTLVLLTPKAP